MCVCPCVCVPTCVAVSSLASSSVMRSLLSNRTSFARVGSVSSLLTIELDHCLACLCLGLRFTLFVRDTGIVSCDPLRAEEIKEAENFLRSLPDATFSVIKVFPLGKNRKRFLRLTRSCSSLCVPFHPIFYFVLCSLYFYAQCWN